jgi:dipeptidyl aminopeptidase/acylaminoacyl peptidase
MTTERDLDRRLSTWLHDEADPNSSPAYLGETLTLLDDTPQRRWLRAVPIVSVVDRRPVPIDRRIVRLALVATLAVAGITASLLVGSGPRPAPSIGPAGNGLLALGDGLDLLLVEPSTGRVVDRVPDALGTELYPAFSPDGTQLAFFSKDPIGDAYGGSPRRLFVMPTDGSRPPAELTDDRAAWDDGEPAPAWSPDGRQIAFVALAIESGVVGVFSVSLDGEGPRLVIGEEGVQRGMFAQPRWSPDGTWISYRGDTPRPDDPGFLDTSLLIVPPEAGPPVLLATTTGQNSSFSDHAWAPDSRRIVYTRRASAESADDLVAVYDIEARTETVISVDGVPAYRPAWAPDGRSVAFFEEQAEGTPSLVIVELATRERTDLGPVVDCFFTWSPDGTSIAGLEPGCKGGVILVPVAEPGRGVTSIVIPGTATGAISWQRVAP